MKCKKHPLDISGTVGVCATCLRNRLDVLIAAQEQAQQSQTRAFGKSVVVVEDRLKSKSHPPPLIFPRSVSPYISHRKSDYTSCHPFSDPRFYSTPQLGHTGPSLDAIGRSSKKKSNKFAFLSKILWPRSKKSELDNRVTRDPYTEPPSTSSWFPSILSGKPKNKLRFTPGERRPCRAGDRGMSPERTSCDGEDDRSSGYSSDSSERWKRTPVTAPATVARRSKPNRNVSGMTFCLSPLVRASPNRNWNQKGGLPPEMTLSGEIRVAAKPHLSTAASFCKNRSKKLADFGRFNNRR